MIFDSRTKGIEVLLAESSATPPSDSGILQARMLRRARIGVVIAGEFGESASRVLQSSHICRARADKISAALAISDFQLGRLTDV